MLFSRFVGSETCRGEGVEEKEQKKKFKKKTFGAAAPPRRSLPPTTSRRRRRRGREEREQKVWEHRGGRERKVLGKWGKKGLQPLYTPFLTGPGLNPNPITPRPNPCPSVILLPFYFLHPDNTTTPPCIHIFFLFTRNMFIYLFFYASLLLLYFFRCILCLVRLRIFILLKHP